MVIKLALETTKHLRQYKLKWLNDSEELNVSRQVQVHFTIGQYKDQITCYIAPMQDGHILLRRP